MADDPYNFLRPCNSNVIGFCNCPQPTPIWLGQEVAHNPVNCMICGMSVRPESVPVPKAIISPLAQWSRIYSALVELFSDPEEYHEWAASKLHDIHSGVNQDGLSLARTLSEIRICFFWYVRPEQWDVGSCPKCSGPTSPNEGGFCRMQICEPCGIVMADRSDSFADFMVNFSRMIEERSNDT